MSAPDPRHYDRCDICKGIRRMHEIFPLDYGHKFLSVRELREELAEAKALVELEGQPIRPEVLAFARAMETQLRANDHKGGWASSAPEWLLKRLRDEVRELAQAIDDHHEESRANFRSVDERPIDWAFHREVRVEAADVANFAMMIADVCGELGTSELPAVPSRAEAAR